MSHEPSSSVPPPPSERWSLPSGESVAREAVLDEQSSRERTSLWTALWMALLSGGALQLTRKQSAPHWVLTAALLVFAAVCAWVLFESRHERRLRPKRTLITGVFTVVVVLAAAAHLGVLSPMIGFLIVTVYYNSSGDAPFEGIIYALSAVGYAALAGLSYAGVLPLTDVVLALAEQNDRALLGFTLVGEGLLYATYRMARQNRLATRTAMERLERAQRQVRQRDALLLEARGELQGASVGGAGRHTGATVDGFVVGDVIGRGATGEVYAAESQGGRPAALKILYPHLLEEEHVTRFKREAEITGKLESPHILRVLGSGSTGDGCPYVATELLAGEDLAQHLRERRRMELIRVVELTAQVARALSVAQESGIVHRDLKPQNVFWALGPEGERSWKVLDFGAAALAEGAGELTRGNAIGTPSYMSPEQTRGESVDHRSDVFALGAIAYRALTGQPAFAAPDAMSTMHRVNRVQPVRPSLLAQLPPDVDAVLALALAKDKEQRFRSAATFAAALRDASRGELDEPYRAAATRLLEKHGWMQEVD